MGSPWTMRMSGRWRSNFADCAIACFDWSGARRLLLRTELNLAQLASYTTLCAKRAGFNFQQYTAERDPNCAHNMSSILRLTHHPNVWHDQCRSITGTINLSNCRTQCQSNGDGGSLCLMLKFTSLKSKRSSKYLWFHSITNALNIWISRTQCHVSQSEM